MACRTLKTLNGDEITLSSDKLEPFDLAVAEILLEMGVEKGDSKITFTMDEMARRLIAKGYDPSTGKPIN